MGEEHGVGAEGGHVDGGYAGGVGFRGGGEVERHGRRGWGVGLLSESGYFGLVMCFILDTFEGIEWINSFGVGAIRGEQESVTSGLSW